MLMFTGPNMALSILPYDSHLSNRWGAFITLVICYQLDEKRFSSGRKSFFIGVKAVHTL